MDLSNQSLWIISVSVFVGGIIGSPHCLSMCGPVVLNFAKDKTSLMYYQLARALSYSFAGAVVGAFGASLLDEGRANWISSLTLVTIAILLLLNGYRAIMGKPLHISMPRGINKWIEKVWSFARRPFLPRSLAAGLAGFLTVLLPCGHLYGFLLGAAVTGSATKGALFMFAFWLGSTPLLSASSGLLQKLIGSKFKKNGQRWAGALLVASGLYSLVAFGSRTENFAKPTIQTDAPNVKSNSPQAHCH